MPEKANHPVQSTRKTLRILDELLEQDGGRITDIAAGVNMNKSTVHNHLSTLEEAEIVVRDGPRYELGLRLLEFGGYLQRHNRLYQVAQGEVARLAEQTGELVSLMVEEYGRGVYLACERGNQAVNVDVYPGLRRPLHVTGSGKAILAHLPSTRVNEIISQQGLTAETTQSVTDRDELLGQLEGVRERGFAVDDEEFIKGLQCVGTSILDGNNSVLGAISVSQPISRANRERLFEEIPDQVRSAANVIELNINYSA